MAPTQRIRKFPLHPGQGHDPRRVYRVRIKVVPGATATFVATTTGGPR
jgi:hypothetical protein